MRIHIKDAIFRLKWLACDEAWQVGILRMISHVVNVHTILIHSMQKRAAESQMYGGAYCWQDERS